MLLKIKSPLPFFLAGSNPRPHWYRLAWRRSLLALDVRAFVSLERSRPEYWMRDRPLELSAPKHLIGHHYGWGRGRSRYSVDVHIHRNGRWEVLRSE